MASWFSTQLANRIINSTLKGTAFTPITQGYLALFTANPTPAGTGTEVSGGSYARQPITIGTPTNGQANNTNAIVFPAMPASTVTHWGIYEGATGTDLVYYGNFDTAVSLVVGDEVKLDANAIIVKLETGV
jgi:hypothetical protein